MVKWYNSWSLLIFHLPLSNVIYYRVFFFLSQCSLYLTQITQSPESLISGFWEGVTLIFFYFSILYCLDTFSYLIFSSLGMVWMDDTIMYCFSKHLVNWNSHNKCNYYLRVLPYSRICGGSSSQQHEWKLKSQHVLLFLAFPGMKKSISGRRVNSFQPW